MINAHVRFKEAKLKYEKALVAEGKTSVKNPIGGVVVKKHFEPDEFVAKGAPLYDVSVLDPIVGVIEVRETDLGVFPVNKRIDLTLEAFPGRKFRARVSKIALEANPQSRRFEVELSLGNPGLALLPGMTVLVDIAGKQEDRIIYVPLKAIIQQGEQSFVFVVENNQARRTKVALGDIVGRRIGISGGLKENDLIVVEGQRFLNEGTSVRVLNPQ